MYVSQKIRRAIILSVMTGGLTLLPNFSPINSNMSMPMSVVLVAHAEIQTCTGTGDYIMPKDGTPESAQEKAKLYAERNALEQAGVFIGSLS